MSGNPGIACILILCVLLLLSPLNCRADDACRPALDDKDLDASIREYVDILKRGMTARELAIYYRDQGDAARKNGLCNKAIIYYGRALGIDPDFVDAYLARAGVYTDKSLFPAAINDYSKAITLGIKNTTIYIRRGVAYYKTGKYDKAIIDLSNAILLSPDNATAYTDRGLAYYRNKDYEKALADYNQAIKLDPQLPEAYYNRAAAYGDKGLYDQAIADYSRAIELEPGNAAACVNRGIIERSKGLYDQAIADYTKAIELDPRNAIIYINRGIALRSKGLYNRAIADYSRAIELDPANLSAYINRGNAYYNTGQYAQAKADFFEATELDPQFGYACLRLLNAIWELKGDDTDVMNRLRKYIASNAAGGVILSVAEYYASEGSVGEEHVLTPIFRDKDIKRRTGMLCRAYFFLGVKRLANGNDEGAADYFNKSVETGDTDCDEYYGSKAMLNRQAPQSHEIPGGEKIASPSGGKKEA